jgi:small-conductance mechanosensitive channel
VDYQSWAEALNESISLLLQKISGYLPNILGALALLIGGWILARVLRFACVRLISGLDSLVRRHGMERFLLRIGMERPASDLIGSIVYWLVLIVFFAGASETLGLPVVAAWLGGVSTYLPRVLVAVLIVLGGFVAGSLARDAIASAATAAGIAYGVLLARVVYVAVLAVAVVTGIDQIGIESRFLTMIMAIVVGSMVGAAALAFSLGARTAVSNIIAAHYLRQIYRVGQTIKIGEAQGKISEITSTAVIVENSNDRILVPAKEFSEKISVLLGRES